MAGLAPAASALVGPNGPAGRTPAAAGGFAAAPASLQAAIRKSLGTAASSARYFQQAELTASGAAAGDQVGYSVALAAAGTTALVGAPDHNTDTGAVYVFTLRHGTWSRTAELTASDGAQEDNFGLSVALAAAGTTALVGAPGHNTGGTAYVFTLRHRTWSQTAELTASNAVADDGLGYSVALSGSGTTALAGAPERNSAAGAAYVFTLRHGVWSQTAELTASDAVADDGLGQSVALSGSGTTALAGAPNRLRVSGAAYVFTLRRGAWSQTAELAGAAAAGLGLSVALSGSGTTALAGAPFYNSNTGAAYVFTLRHRTWSRTAELTASNPASTFGESVALSARGTTALAGAVERASVTGAAYAFTLRHGTWSRTAELTASDAMAADGFGQSVALSALGTTALAGAPERNDATGAAYVFRARHGA